MEPNLHDPKQQEEDAIQFQKRSFGTDFEAISNSFKQGIRNYIIFMYFLFNFLYIGDFEEVCGKLRVLKVLLRRWRNDKCKV